MGESVERMASEAERLIQQDPGERNLARWALSGELLPAARSLYGGDAVIITTGYYILTAGTIETDGPPGAFVLSMALQAMGRDVRLLIDGWAADVFRHALNACRTPISIETMSSPGFIDGSTVFTPRTTHFIAIERPGRASDGKYYNLRGKDISSHIAHLDHLFEESRERKITTIGVGDGGNELGMERVASGVERAGPSRIDIGCRTDADYVICCGVSNWGGYALAALLSKLCGGNLMPNPEVLDRFLLAITEAGAVDGITGLPTPTVDGLPYEWERRIYTDLYERAGAIHAAEKKNG
jgi:hypothetical protein